MSLSDEVARALESGRTPDQIIDDLKARGLSEATARRFLERSRSQGESGLPARRGSEPVAVLGTSGPPSHAIPTGPAQPPTRCAEPLARRMLLMPVLPGLWSKAAHWRLRDVLLPLAALALVLNGGLAVYRAWGVRNEFRSWAQRYDASYPAVSVEGGSVRVEGEGVIQFVEGDQTFLVDPKETIPLETIGTPDYIVVRQREILRRRSSMRTEVTNIAAVQKALSIDPVRTDGPALRSFDERWGMLAQLACSLLLLAFILGKELVGAAVLIPLAAGLALGCRRGSLMTFGQVARVASAAYSVPLVLAVVLNLVGAGPGLCFGSVLWAALLTGLAVWRTGPGGEAPKVDVVPPDSARSETEGRLGPGGLARRALFGLLAAVSLVLLGRGDPVVALGHIVALWCICWIGQRGAQRGLLWLALGLAAYGVAWRWMPIVPLLALYVGERMTRPKPTRSSGGPPLAPSPSRTSVAGGEVGPG